MPYKKNANRLSFTRLSFASEVTRLTGKIMDEVPIEPATSSFRNYMNAHHSTTVYEHEGLQAQILLAQMVQESDE